MDDRELVELLRKHSRIGHPGKMGYECVVDKSLLRNAADRLETLAFAPVANDDVVEVIRCKDCKFSLPSTHEGYLLCSAFVNKNYVVPNGFCSEVEIKD